MQYWKGYMNWPLNKEWKCPTCGDYVLIWGLIHAQCRCSTCHTEFYMRDENQEVTDTPVCMLKEEYKEPAKFGFEYFKKPISMFCDDEWDYAFGQCIGEK